MTSRYVLGVGIAFLLAGTSCSHSPESFCKSWVEDTCTAIAGCCASGTKYDVDECQLSLSQTCDQGTDVEKVHSGEVVFDSGAANDCFGQVATCSDLATAANDTSFDHVKACANVLTGFRPLGAECSSSRDCEKAGEFSACYDGNAGGNNGVCAKVVLDTAVCSFSFTTNELHICPDNTFCDLSGFKTSPNDPPTIQHYEFTAKCRNDVAVGGACVVSNKPLPCAQGLFCEAKGGKFTCATRKLKGATCTGADECEDGLSCQPKPGGGGQTCQLEPGPYCFSVTKCGDGICNGNETAQSCPKDCSQCGDGICNGTETPQTCPIDCQAGCNNDGFCDPGETPVNCPADCFCGDGVCSPPFETINNCPQDC